MGRPPRAAGKRHPWWGGGIQRRCERPPIVLIKGPITCHMKEKERCQDSAKESRPVGKEEGGVLRNRDHHKREKKRSQERPNQPGGKSPSPAGEKKVENFKQKEGLKFLPRPPARNPRKKGKRLKRERGHEGRFP